MLASLGFYAYWRLDFLPLLLISIGFNYLTGALLVRTSARPRLQTAIFLVGLAGDLLALFYFKYAAALASSLGFANRCRHPARRNHPAARHLVLHLHPDRLLGGREAGRGQDAGPAQLRPVRHLLPASDCRTDPAQPRDDAAIRRPGDLPLQQPPTSPSASPSSRSGWPRRYCWRTRYRPTSRTNFAHPGTAGLVAAWYARHWLLAAALFRLLWLFRHGDRAGADVQHPVPAEFQLALQGDHCDRLLAALPHDADAVHHDVHLQPDGALASPAGGPRTGSTTRAGRRRRRAASLRSCWCRRSSPWGSPASGTARARNT